MVGSPGHGSARGAVSAAVGASDLPLRGRTRSGKAVTSTNEHPFACTTDSTQRYIERGDVKTQAEKLFDRNKA